MSTGPSIHKTLIGGACLSLQPLVLNALSVPAVAYIIRGLGPTAYGQWTVATALTGVMAIVCSLGLRGAFIRQVAAEPEIAASALANQLGLRLALATIAGIASILLCFALNYSSVIVACAAISSVTMIVATLSTTLVDLLQSIHRLATVAAVNLAGGLVLTAVSVAVVWLKMGPIAVSVAYLIGPIVSGITLLIIVQKEYPIQINFDWPNAKQLLYRARSFAAQTLLNGGASYADALLLPRLIGVASFGFYSAGTLLPSRLATIPDGLCTAAYPLLSRRFRQSTASGVRLTFKYIGLVLLACLPIALLGMMFAGPIARILFPREPAICRQVILITIWALPLLGIESVLGYAINAAGADAAQARASLPAALCNIVLTVLLMTRLGILGACIAMPMRNVVRIVILLTCFMRRICGERMTEMPAQAALAA